MAFSEGISRLKLIIGFIKKLLHHHRLQNVRKRFKTHIIHSLIILGTPRRTTKINTEVPIA